jgi:hypothetical protein
MNAGSLQIPQRMVDYDSAWVIDALTINVTHIPFGRIAPEIAPEIALGSYHFLAALYLPRLTHVSLGNTNRDAALVSGQKLESHPFQQILHSPYSRSLALSNFALFESNNTRLVGRPSETEDDSLAQMKEVAISMSADTKIPVFKERIECHQTYIRRNGDHVHDRTFFLTAGIHQHSCASIPSDHDTVHGRRV